MSERIKGLARRVGAGRMSNGEYQANLNGLNMFFSAALGLVLAGTEKLTTFQFGILLLCMASMVVTVLYISSSKNRLVYSALALLYAATFPELMDFMLRGHDLVPDKVRPTLLVWVLMTIAVEFWARERTQAADPAGPAAVTDAAGAADAADAADPAEATGTRP